MNVISLEEGLYVYQLDPAEGEVEGLNFMVVIEDGKALFIDTGYEQNMRTALADLGRRKAVPSCAIISHYHPDHDGGLALLGGIDIWASALWRKTAEACRGPGAPGAVEPGILISKPTALRFGKRELEIHPLPGHSEDSLAVLIDDTWLYVADSILLTNEGAALLPSVHGRPISLHIEAIDWLMKRSDRSFIPGHGAILRDRAAREKDLENRRRYLVAISGAKGGITFEEATASCEPPFIGREWHEENYR